MSTHWLIRINTVLLWLNRGLCVVACTLAVLVVAAAGERAAGMARSAGIQAARPGRAPPVRAECARPMLSPELRELRLYD